MDFPAFIQDLPPALKVLSIIVLAVLAHLGVQLGRRLSEWILVPSGVERSTLTRRYPKLTTLITILVSALTFVIYFGAIGFIFKEMGISLTAYLASASVIGLAVGFGSQGLVQDVVIGLTLIFSDVLDIGDIVDVSGQTGRVERIGLRFTVLVNLLDQKVYIPNRNIGQINRYRNGYIRVYVDVQLPEGVDEQQMTGLILPIAEGMHAQHQAVILTAPEAMGIRSAEPGGWTYLRIKFRMWPGQGVLLETTFKQRALATLRLAHPAYADFMITITYRAD